MNECTNSTGHSWRFVRMVRATETYDVKINDEDGNAVDPSTFPGDLYPTATDAAAGDLDVTDCYDEVLWCRYCPHEIRGERIKEIEFS